MKVSIIISKDGTEAYVGHIISKSETELNVLVKVYDITSFEYKTLMATNFDIYSNIDEACTVIIDKTNKKVELLKNELKIIKRKNYPDEFLKAKKDLIDKTKLIAKNISEDNDMSFPDNLKEIVKLKDKFYSLSKSLIPEMTADKQKNDSLNKEIKNIYSRLTSRINLLKENYRLAANYLEDV